MATQMVTRRMKRELQLLSGGSAAPGITAWPRHEEDRLDVLDAEICGATDTPYEGGSFRLEIHIPPEYPLKPPRVRFITPIYHPNIDSQGRICLDTLIMPPKGAWKPSLNICTVLTTIQALMSSPNPEDGLMIEITDEYRRNPALFRSKARTFTDKHACSSEPVSRAGPSSISPQHHVAPLQDDPRDESDKEHEAPSILGRLKKKPRHE